VKKLLGLDASAEMIKCRRVKKASKAYVKDASLLRFLMKYLIVFFSNCRFALDDRTRKSSRGIFLKPSNHKVGFVAEFGGYGNAGKVR